MRPMPPYRSVLHALTAPSKTMVAALLNGVTVVGGGALTVMSGLLSAGLMMYSSYVLYDSFYTQNQAFASSWDLIEYRPAIIEDGATPLAGADTLASINADYRAWLTMYETKIDYPVMQGKDDLYYSSHDIYGKTSLTGAIYLAAGSDGDLADNYSIIYGHHMDNSAMFGGLDKYKDSTYFKEHREGILVCKNAVYDLNAFAVVETDAYESAVYTTGDRDFNPLFAYIRTHCVQLDEGVMQSAEKIVALSTCRDAVTNGRLVVFCRATVRTDQEEDDDDDDDEPEPEPVAVAPTQPPVTPPPASSAPPPPVNPGNPGDSSPDDPSEHTGDHDPGDGEVIEDPGTPLARFISNFQPAGSTHGPNVWSLVNLVSLVFTAYILFPVMHLKAKFSRGRMMKRINGAKQELREARQLQRRQRLERERIERMALENRANSAALAEKPKTGEITIDEFVDAVETLYYQATTFVRRFRFGILVELLSLIFSLITFLLTQDMRLPMVLIDRWTPLMLFFLILSFIVDFTLARYRNRILAEEEEDIRDRAARIRRATMT